jgi:hypothetical protein
MNGYQIVNELMAPPPKRVTNKAFKRGRRKKVCPKKKVHGTKCFYKYG